MDLTKLQKKINPSWRVQSFSKNKPSAQCVAYIDARDVMKILDEAVGAGNWQDDYKIVGDMLIAGVGIKIEDQWVWKWDTGSESNMEAEKGHMSDAFKRAAVKWGVGRFLYDMPIQFLKASEVKTSSNYPQVVDDTGKTVYDISKYINEKLNIK